MQSNHLFDSYKTLATNAAVNGTMTMNNTDAALKLTSTKPRNGAFQVDDPLWTRICKDISKLMGSLSLPLKNCKLGEICHESHTVEVYNCTPEAMRLLKEFDFVVIPILQKYFPSVNELKIANAYS